MWFKQGQREFLYLQRFYHTKFRVDFLLRYWYQNFTDLNFVYKADNEVKYSTTKFYEVLQSLMKFYKVYRLNFTNFRAHLNEDNCAKLHIPKLWPPMYVSALFMVNFVYKGWIRCTQDLQSFRLAYEVKANSPVLMWLINGAALKPKHTSLWKINRLSLDGSLQT